MAKPAKGGRMSGLLARELSVGERIFATGQDRKVAAALDDGLEAIERRLVKETSFTDVIADSSARYLLEAGGKRVRPALMLLVAQLGRGTTDQVITAATAIEITHLASLYHDDVMDDANMRRGVPSAQEVWGNSVAILTGDLLFARASKLVSSLGQRAIDLQANTFERLCLGQLHETVGPRENDEPIAHYIQVLADKTGSLIAAAAEMGAVFSGADEEYREPVLQFGERIGIAFQIIDDIIDLNPRKADGTSETGKPQGTDLRAGVVTLPLLYLQRLAASDEQAAALLERLEAEVIGKADAASASLIEELRQHEATRLTLEEAKRWAAQAVAAITPLPEGTVKKALVKFSETVISRTT